MSEPSEANDLGQWRIGHLNKIVSVDVHTGALAIYVSGKLMRAETDAAGDPIAPFLVEGSEPGVFPTVAEVFSGPDDGPLHPSNLLMRVFKPLAEEAGVPWAGFHAQTHLRITFVRPGRNAVQVQPCAALEGCQRSVRGTHANRRHSGSGD